MARSLLFVLAAVASYCLPNIMGTPVSSDKIVRGENGMLPTGPYVRYTALGDSYTAGDMHLSGIAEDPDKACHRTVGSYAWQFAQRHLDTLQEFSFPACSGADTDAIEKEINSTEPGIGPIANYGFGHPDLVSITAGGNNGHIFNQIVKACVSSSKKMGADCRKALEEANKGADKLLLPLGSLYLHASTHNLNPAKLQRRDVFVLGYARFYNPMGVHCPPEGSEYFPVPSMGIDGTAARINALVVRMNNVIKAAAEVTGATYVDVDAAFEGHRICDRRVGEGEFQDDLVYYMKGEQGKDGYAPFHPTKRGHYEMMLAFEKAAYKGKS